MKDLNAKLKEYNFFINKCNCQNCFLTYNNETNKFEVLLFSKKFIKNKLHQFQIIK